MDVELLVEGVTDEVFVRQCYRRLGIGVGTVYGKRGVGYVLNRARQFSIRGQFSPLLILADLMDVCPGCAPTALTMLVPDQQPRTLVRLAVNEVESWLLASRAELAGYFGISMSRVPAAPDELADPKQALVNLARQSPRARIRKMFVPKPGISSVVGEGYVEGFTDFMLNHWDIDSATAGSPSFERFVHRSCERFL